MQLNDEILFGLEKFLAEKYIKSQDKILFQACYNPAMSLDSIVHIVTKTFQDKLFSMIREKNLDEVDVYKNANITRQAFSKIRSKKDYHPSKNTVFSLAIGMKLNMDEASELLEKAGYTFSSASKSDLIVQYFIYHKIYNIDAINEALNKYGFGTL